MRASKILSSGMLFVTFAIASCSRNPAPPGWLAPAPQAAHDPYGAWIELEVGGLSESETLRGELIAVTDDSVFVLTEAAQLHAVAQADATRARVAFFDSQYYWLTMWTSLGSLATLSHGAFLLISLPVWLITGPIATGSQSRAPLVDIGPRQGSWGQVGKYSRFPQGLPPQLDRSQLRPKQGRPPRSR